MHIHKPKIIILLISISFSLFSFSQNYIQDNFLLKGSTEDLLYDADKIKIAIKANPNIDSAHYTLGLLYFNLGKKRKALREFKKAVKENDSNIDALFFIGYLGHQWNSNKRLELYNKALKINKDYIPALYLKSSELMQKRKYIESLSGLNYIIELNDQIPDIWYERALTNYLNSNNKSAISDLNKAIELNNEYGMAYFTRGSIKYFEGEKDQACEDFQNALKYKIKMAKRRAKNCK